MKTISEKKVGKTVMRLVQGDITERDVDAIVNAADSHLQHGGGVAGAIIRRGGGVIQDESDRIGYTPVGTSVITSGGNLPARLVIHTVGPRMGEGDEDNKLKNAVKSALVLASGRSLKSVSIPAISSGIFGFPKDLCAQILVQEAAEYLRDNVSGSLELVEFCIYDDLTLGYFRREFEKITEAGFVV